MLMSEKKRLEVVDSRPHGELLGSSPPSGRTARDDERRVEFPPLPFAEDSPKEGPDVEFRPVILAPLSLAVILCTTPQPISCGGSC